MSRGFSLFKPGSHDSALYKRNREMLRRMGKANRTPCAYCGLPIDYDAPMTSPFAFTADHLTPVSRGGTDQMTNLVPAHAKCNRAKSDMTVDSIRLSPNRTKATRRW